SRRRGARGGARARRPRRRRTEGGRGHQRREHRPEPAREGAAAGFGVRGRYLAFRTWLEDKPGMLHELTGLLAREHINILHVGIHRLGPYASLGRVGLDVIVDTRDRAHADAVLALLRTHGFAAEELFATAPTHT